MIILKLVSTKGNTYIYKDGQDHLLTLETMDVSWSFKVSSESPELMRHQHRIVDVFVDNGIRQDEYKGGFSEAISILLIQEINL